VDRCNGTPYSEVMTTRQRRTYFALADVLAILCIVAGANLHLVTCVFFGLGAVLFVKAAL